MRNFKLKIIVSLLRVYEFTSLPLLVPENTLSKILVNTFTQIRSREIVFQYSKIILCCTETMIYDEVYIRCVAVNILGIDKDHVYITGTKTPIYDYWISKAGSLPENNTIYAIIRMEVSEVGTRYKAAFFIMRSEEKSTQRMTYFDMIANTGITEFLEQFQRKKDQYKNFKLIALCKTDTNVPEKDVNELKYNIHIANIIYPDEYDRVRGALLKLQILDFVSAEEYADLTYKPICKFTTIRTLKIIDFRYKRPEQNFQKFCIYCRNNR